MSPSSPISRPRRCGGDFGLLVDCPSFTGRPPRAGALFVGALLLLSACVGGKPGPEGAEIEGSATDRLEDRAESLQATTPMPKGKESERAPEEATKRTAPSDAAEGESAFESLGIALEAVAGGFDEPLLVTYAPDGSGRLYVVEQAGRVRMFDPDAPDDAPQLVLDIRDRIQSRGSEQGLLGLAFHPGFAQTRRLFVNYTARASDGGSVVSEFRSGADRAIDPESERTILTFDQPAANHNGGHLAFGPDGHLYIATGDGGGADDRYGHGQRKDSLLGKILRIDVNATGGDAAYGIPADNPYVDQGEFRPEVFAWGLRNPWRFSFDRQDAALFIGDVGQNRWEEIDRIPAGDRSGLNFGWPLFEGFACFKSQADCLTAQAQAFTPPILAYSHEDGPGCSVTGGFVVRAEGARPPWAGTYLYADYCSGRIWGARQEADGRWTNRMLLESGMAISSFGEGEDGTIYLSDHQEGRIHRIVPLAAETR